MAMVGFKSTNNQVVYINPAQVIYVTMFEPDVSIVAFAVSGHNGQPAVIHVRGSVELVQAKLSGTLSANGSVAPAAETVAAAKAPRQPRG
jgi:hypothetical protein